MVKVYSNHIEEKKILEKNDLKTKKEIAKKGMYISAGVTVASAFFTKNDFFRDLNMIAAASTIGFATWNHMLNNPKKISNKNKTTKIDKTIKALENEKLAITLNNFYIEFSIKGVLTKEEFKIFEQKIESLLELYTIPQMNVLIDIREIEGIEFKSLWDDLLFAIRHFKEIQKVSVVGNKRIEEYTINFADKLTSKELHYFKKYEEAHKWLLN